jgi:dihydrofolate reductase
MFEIVVAVNSENGIGLDNKLPWHDPRDLKKFRLLTSVSRVGRRNAVIMGRNTWNSLPQAVQPLPNRQNIVITSTPLIKEGVLSYDNFQSALDVCQKDTSIDRIFIIGGAKLYAEALLHPDCHIVHKSAIDSDVVCDTFFPSLDMSVWTWIMGDVYMKTTQNAVCM